MYLIFKGKSRIRKSQHCRFPPLYKFIGCVALTSSDRGFLFLLNYHQEVDKLGFSKPTFMFVSPSRAGQQLHQSKLSAGFVLLVVAAPD